MVHRLRVFARFDSYCFPELLTFRPFHSNKESEKEKNKKSKASSLEPYHVYNLEWEALLRVELSFYSRFGQKVRTGLRLIYSLFPVNCRAHLECPTSRL